MGLRRQKYFSPAKKEANNAQTQTQKLIGKMEFSSSLMFLKGLFYSFICFLVIAACILVPPIIRPTVIEYPWRFPDSPTHRERDKRRTVVLAGSFNPPHNGHLAMIEYLSKRYGQVIVVIGVNPTKKYLVSPIQRVELLRKMLDYKKITKNVRVEVYKGYIWRFAKEQGASIFFRGIRSWGKDGAEERNLQILNTWGPFLLGPLYWPLPTIYLAGKPEYNHISSTLIRNISKNMETENNRAGRGEQELKKLVPTEMAGEVAELYSGN